MAPASLACPQCRKNYKVKEYDPARSYSCPACKGPLVGEASQAPTVAVKPGIGFRDEPPPPPREIPVRLGKYLIDSEIARGGMGVVYKGRQEGLDRVVAIKMLLGGFAADPASLQRFHREARAAARLRHPNIVAIHEVGDSNGLPFFTMDFIEGKSLDRLLLDGPMRPELAARLLRDIARAAHYAHEQGIIHRDLKPGNILVDGEGKPLVTDFGLAKDVDSKSLLSVTGDVMGTPAFMAPEQAEGRVREIDRQTDVYSLGAVLYRILTGRVPFDAPTVAATIYKVIHEYTTEPVRLNPRVPAELSAICMKAMDKEKKGRYATAGELADDLDRFLSGEPVAARPVTAWQLLRRKLRQQRKAVAAAGVVAAIALVAIVAILLVGGKSDLDLIEENLAKPELRLTALGSLVDGLDRFKDRKRALALAKAAIEKGRDDASRELAYAKPVADLAEAYAAHLPIEKPEKLRIRLVQLLAKLKSRAAVPGVVDLLYSARGPVRLEAVRFFKAVPDIRAFHALGALVSDRECGEEARQAIQRLYVGNVIAFYNPSAGKIGGAISDLGSAIEKYNKQMDDLLRETGSKGPKDGVEMAIVALRSPDRDARTKAAYELGESKDGRAREPLFAALQDADDGVARLAAASLAALGAVEYRDRIVEQLKAPRAVVRRNAAFLLGKSGDKSGRPAIESAYKSESDADAKYAMEDALVLLR
jgi:HEAT repeat protein/predicted Ser/Thr protein kinase